MFTNFLKNTKLFYISFIFVAFLVFFVHYQIAGQAVYGDGIDYYAYLHTLYFDHNLDFTNEREHIYNHEYNNSHPNFLGNINKADFLSTGKINNFHPLGMAILLFPFYIAADVLVLLLNLFGFNFLRNGYSDIYQIIVGFGAVLYGGFGLLLVEKTILNIYKDYKNKASLLTIRLSLLTILLVSPLFYYLAIDVINSHFASFFVSSLFFFSLFKKNKNLFKKYLTLGAILGLATTIRFQDFMLIIPLLIMTYFERKQWGTIIKLLGASAITFLIFVSPLILSWWYLFGNIFKQEYFHGGKIVLGSLFDIKNGLFGRTPFLLVTLLALPLAFKKLREPLIALIVYFFFQYLAVSSYGGWGAASYGARMYISSLFLFFILCPLLFYYLKLKLGKAATIAIVLFFIFLNISNILLFMLFQKEAVGTRGLETTTKIKIEKMLNL